MTKKALVVGIDNYKSYNNLEGCVDDAIMISEVLSFNHDRSRNFNVITLTNTQEKNELYSNIRSLFQGEYESALLYFSGHGYVDDLNKASLVTPDAEEYSMGIAMDDILNIANRSSIRNKVIILDCCFSGNMGNFSGDGTHASLADGVTILTASKRDEPSIEVNGRGIFSSLLESALKGGASDLLGNITPGSVYSYIDKALGPWEQRPVFKTNVSKFDVLRKVSPPIDIEILRELSKIFQYNNELQLDPSYEPTNHPNAEHKTIEPFTDEDNSLLFEKLQKLVSVGLVSPVGEKHMYYAALNSKKCQLTPLGEYYKKLADKGSL